LFYAAKLEI